jgi:hypothetical protein
MRKHRLSKAPILLFVYNRPDHTRKTVDALRANAGAIESDLYIYSDGPKRDRDGDAVRAVRAYLPSIAGFRSINITERANNMGLAASVIAGVSEILERHERAIVVEDDLITAPDFLSFMNEALAVYENRADIFSVTGYNYPLSIPDTYPQDAYLSYRSSSWGWGTWLNRWKKIDWEVSDFKTFLSKAGELEKFARGGDDLLAMLKLQMDGKLDSWSIRFDYAHYKHDATCVHPTRSRLTNIGFDGSGVHCAVSDEYDVALDATPRTFHLPSNLPIDPFMQGIFNERFRPGATASKRHGIHALISPKRRLKALIRTFSLGTWKS